MNTKFGLICLLSIIFYTNGNTQSRIYADGELNAGFEHNIYKSPDSYLDRNGVLFNKKDLIQSGSFYGAGWRLKYKNGINNKHSFYIKTDGDFRNYLDVTNANSWETAINGNYEYNLNKKLNLGYELEVKKSKQLVTNILGVEITAPFKYTQLINEVYAEYEGFKNNVTTLSAYYQVRRYVADPNTEPLSYNTPAVEISTEQTIYLGKTKTELELGVSSKGRNYTERTARDANNNIQLGYPTRDWSYFIAEMAYRVILNDNFEFEPFIAYQKRIDHFQDQFSYDEIKTGISLDYETDKLDADLTIKNYNKDYVLREALQVDGTTIPLLYKYFTVSLEVEYFVSERLGFFVSTDYINRNTNVTSIEKRPRRNYTNYQVYGGIRYDFKKVL